MPVQRVVVEVHLRVEREHRARAGEDQRVDLGKRGIGFPERPVQRLQDLARLGRRRGRDADGAGEVVGLVILQSGGRIAVDLVDLLGRARGDLFYVHASLGGGHHAHLLRHTVDDDAEIELLADVGTLLDQEPPHFLSLASGLMGDELHAENFRREQLDFVRRPGELDAAALAAAARMDLGLDHPHLSAQLSCRVHRLLDGKAGDPARGFDAVSAQDFLCLVFVDLHRFPLFDSCY